ncbi:MAG: HEPN domain-containing protein [Anaerolineae bacterium]
MGRGISEAATSYLTNDERASVTDFLQALDHACGDHVARVVLFGSRARGDHTAESDIDLLIVGTDGADEIRVAVKELRPDAVPLSVLVMSQADYQHHQWLQDPLYVNVRRDGIELWDTARFIAEEHDIPLSFPEGQRRPMDAATREVIAEYLRHAARNLKEAHVLIDADLGEGAISCAYYAAFHAASAALYAVNVVRGKHVGVQGALSQFLIAPGRLEPTYKDIYNRLFALRHSSDYDPKFIASLAEARRLVADADAFVVRVRQFLDEGGEGEPLTETDS